MGKRRNKSAHDSLERWLVDHTSRHARVDHGGGLCTVITTPKAGDREVWNHLAVELESSDAPVRLSPTLSLYDLWSSGGETVLFLSVDDDSSDRLPCAPGDDHVAGLALLPVLDIGERSGVDQQWFEAQALPSRNELLATPTVPWQVAAGLFDKIESHIGPEALRRGCRETADLTADVAAMGPDDVVGILRFVHEVVINEVWKPIFSRVVPVRAGVTCVRMTVRQGLVSAPALFSSHAGTLESMPRHIRLPYGRAVRFCMSADASQATYLLQHAVDAGDGTADSFDPVRARLEPAVFIQSRTAARAQAIDTLVPALSHLSNVHELADALLDTIGNIAPVERIELLLDSQAGGLRPFRIRGAPGKTQAMVRVLRQGTRTVGELRVFAPATSAGTLLAALDLVQSWVGAAIGTALTTAALRQQAEAEAVVTHQLYEAIDETLARLPRAAYLVQPHGDFVPKNAAAERLARTASALTTTLAEALGSPDSLYERIAMPRAHGGVLLVARGDTETLDARLGALAQESGLSPRRHEVARLMLSGKSVDHIAETLDIRPGTVRAHLTAVYRALGVDGHVALLVKVLSNEGIP